MPAAYLGLYLRAILSHRSMNLSAANARFKAGLPLLFFSGTVLLPRRVQLQSLRTVIPMFLVAILFVLSIRSTRSLETCGGRSSLLNGRFLFHYSDRQVSRCRVSSVDPDAHLAAASSAAFPGVHKTILCATGNTGCLRKLGTQPGRCG